MKLEVGMYVRTKKGIRQIIKIDEDNNYYIDKTYINDFRQEIDCISDSCIIDEPSFNPIDLIEVGDYVNEYLVEDITSVYDNGEEIITLHIASGSNYFQHNINDIKEIKSIVTKEQFESMKYSLEG